MSRVYSGPERRGHDRAPLARPRVLGWVRVAASFPQTHTPPMPRDRWFHAVEPTGQVADPGCLWVDVDGKLRYVFRAHVEIVPLEDMDEP